MSPTERFRYKITIVRKDGTRDSWFTPLNATFSEIGETVVILSRDCKSVKIERIVE